MINVQVYIMKWAANKTQPLLIWIPYVKAMVYDPSLFEPYTCSFVNGQYFHQFFFDCVVENKKQQSQCMTIVGPGAALLQQLWKNDRNLAFSDLTIVYLKWLIISLHGWSFVYQAWQQIKEVFYSFRLMTSPPFKKTMYWCFWVTLFEFQSVCYKFILMCLCVCECDAKCQIRRMFWAFVYL